MSEPAADAYLGAVLATVAQGRGEPAERLRDRLDADLVTELGFDSIQVLGIWAELEARFGIPEGELGVSQAITARTIAAALAQLAGARAVAP